MRLGIRARVRVRNVLDRVRIELGSPQLSHLCEIDGGVEEIPRISEVAAQDLQRRHVLRERRSRHSHNLAIRGLAAVHRKRVTSEIVNRLVCRCEIDSLPKPEADRGCSGMD